MKIPVHLTVVIELLVLKFHSTSSGSTYHERVPEKRKRHEKSPFAFLLRKDHASNTYLSMRGKEEMYVRGR
jgi:hypothetical protein